MAWWGGGREKELDLDTNLLVQGHRNGGGTVIIYVCPTSRFIFLLYNGPPCSPALSCPACLSPIAWRLGHLSQYERHFQRSHPVRRISLPLRLARGCVGTCAGAQDGEGGTPGVEGGRGTCVRRRAAVRPCSCANLGGHAEGNGATGCRDSGSQVAEIVCVPALLEVRLPARS